MLLLVLVLPGAFALVLGATPPFLLFGLGGLPLTLVPVRLPMLV